MLFPYFSHSCGVYVRIEMVLNVVVGICAAGEFDWIRVRHYSSLTLLCHQYFMQHGHMRYTLDLFGASFLRLP